MAAAAAEADAWAPEMDELCQEEIFSFDFNMPDLPTGVMDLQRKANTIKVV
jgi:hypothetical protein